MAPKRNADQISGGDTQVTLTIEDLAGLTDAALVAHCKSRDIDLKTASTKRARLGKLQKYQSKNTGKDQEVHPYTLIDLTNDALKARIEAQGKKAAATKAKRIEQLSKSLPTDKQTAEGDDKAGDEASAKGKDWSKLKVTELQRHCEQRSISIFGPGKKKLLKAKLVALLKEWDLTHENAPNDQKDSGRASTDQDNTADSAVKPKDRKKLLKPVLQKECTAAGINWTVRMTEARLIELLEEHDEKQEKDKQGEEGKDSSGGEGKDSSGGEGKGSSGGHGSIWPPSLVQVTGRTPSPTTSIGPQFPSAQVASQEMIASARSNETNNKLGLGFENTGNTCFRNAVIVMLLHSNRILSWIEHHHIPTLYATSIEIVTYSEPRYQEYEKSGEVTAVRGRRRKPGHYTDVWCELLELSKVYFGANGSNQDNVDAAMEIFWQYLGDPQRQQEFDTDFTDVISKFGRKRGGREVKWKPTGKATKQRVTGSQEDAREFLEWLMTLASCQLGTYREEARTRDSLDEDILNLLDTLPEDGFTELTGIAFASRRRCIKCGPAKDERIRSDRLEEGVLMWPVPTVLNDPVTNNRRSPIELAECLKGDLKAVATGYLCDNCRADLDAEDEKHRTKAGAADKLIEFENRLQDAKDNRFDSQTWQYKSVCRLPEVLILSLNHFASGTANTKSGTIVRFGELLNLNHLLERRFRDTDPVATYRLVAIVNHNGNKNKGHYIGQTYRSGKWRKFDDNDVDNDTLDDIINAQAGGSGAWSPYLFLYEKVAKSTRASKGGSGDGTDGDKSGKGGSGSKSDGDNGGEGKSGSKSDGDSGGNGGSGKRSDGENGGSGASGRGTGGDNGGGGGSSNSASDKGKGVVKSQGGKSNDHGRLPEGSGNTGQSTGGQQTSSAQTPSLFKTPYVQDQLGNVFNRMQRYFQQQILHQAAPNTAQVQALTQHANNLSNELQAAEDALAICKEEWDADVDSIIAYWRGREAAMLNEISAPRTELRDFGAMMDFADDLTNDLYTRLEESGQDLSGYPTYARGVLETFRNAREEMLGLPSAGTKRSYDADDEHDALWADEQASKRFKGADHVHWNTEFGLESDQEFSSNKDHELNKEILDLVGDDSDQDSVSMDLGTLVTPYLGQKGKGYRQSTPITPPKDYGVLPAPSLDEMRQVYWPQMY